MEAIELKGKLGGYFWLQLFIIWLMPNGFEGRAIGWGISFLVCLVQAVILETEIAVIAGALVTRG